MILSQAVIFYPWGDILENNSGASRRVNLLIKFLSPLYRQLRVLSDSTFSDGTTENVRADNVEYLFVQKGPNMKAMLRTKLESYGLLHESPFSAELDMRRRFGISTNEWQFAKAVDQVLVGCDVAFLEYPFWAEVVLPLCRRHQVKSILTNIDVLATSVVPEPEISEYILKKELQAIQMADFACCVSAADKAYFEAHGTRPLECIENPVDLDVCRVPVPNDLVNQFRIKYNLGEQPICLFVGSLHHHNLSAVPIIKRIAQQTPGCIFLLAGRCASPECAENLISLGSVTEEELRVLYSVADIILLPLIGGTGSSLKTVEAMGYGKPILASTVACRGYAIEPGIHAIVSDDFAAYPALINALLVDDAERVRLSQNAGLLAARYDYRVVYQRYLRLLASG